MPLTYDELGHVKMTKLQNTSATGNKTISTSAVYSTDGDYLVSQTDALGYTTTYETNTYGLTSAVVDALNHRISYTYNTNNNRLLKTSLEDGTNVAYNYTNGTLSSIVRESLLPDGETESSQTYSFNYDIYDNVTAVKVGSRTLASYTYMANNGPLTKVTYGNGYTIEYGYDILGRIVTETQDGVLKYRYLYSSEGDLCRQEELNVSGTVEKAVCYEYDSLDRLIRSWEEELRDGVLARILSTEHIYDTSNRLVKQSWKTEKEADL